MWRLAGAVLRRWYLALPLLALSVVGAWLAGNQLRPEYTADAAVMVVRPAGDGTGTEPATPATALTTATAALDVALKGSFGQEALRRAGSRASVDVSPVPREPILRLMSRAPTPEDATSSLQVLLDVASQHLHSWQTNAGTIGTKQLRLELIDQPNEAKATNKGKKQRQVLAFGVLALVALLGTVVVDDLLLRRSGKRQRDNAAGRDGATEQTLGPDAAPWEKDVIDHEPYPEISRDGFSRTTRLSEGHQQSQEWWDERYDSGEAPAHRRLSRQDPRHESLGGGV